MATSVKYPQSNDGGAPASGGTFSNLTYAYLADGNLANILSITRSQIHTVCYYNFAMGIPTGATINSVNVEVRWKVDTTISIARLELQIAKGTTKQGTALINDAEPTTLITENTSLNGSWTVSELNDNTSGTGLSVIMTFTQGADNDDWNGSWDYIKVTVDYTAPIPQGGSEVAVGVSVEGLGTKISGGNSEASVGVGVEGTGKKISSGSSETGITISVEGQGVRFIQGSSEASISLSVEGTGIKGGRSPPAEALVGLATEGAGIKKSSSGSESATIIDVEGLGKKVNSGNSEASISISTEGSGKKVSVNGSEISVIVSVEGSGQKVVGIPEGGSESQVIISAQGTGLKITSGSGESSVIITVEGAGQKPGSNELKYPATTKQVMAYNGVDVYHFVTVETNQVCTSGQPTMEAFDTKALLGVKFETCNSTDANKEDYQRFINQS